MSRTAALDHCLIAASDREIANRFNNEVVGADVVEQGSGRWVARLGARDAGTNVYFRDPDGSLLEFSSYEDGKG